MYKNVYSPIKSLERAPEINPGGLCWILFVLWEDVTAWPKLNPATATVTDPLELRAGASIYNCRPVERDRFFREEEKSAAAGEYVEARLNIRLAGSTKNNALTLSRLKHHQLVFLFKDRDGRIRLMGDRDSGARKSSNYDSGQGDTTSGSSVQFLWEHPESLPFYETDAILVGGVSTDLDEAVKASVEFSDEFSTEYNN